MLLENKVCVVTGAAGGLGEGIARAYAKEGATICGIDILEDKVSKVIDEIGGKAYVCDMRSVTAIEKTFSEIKKDYGRVDVLINGAGLANRTPIEDITEEEWDLLNDVNLKASFFAAKEAYKIMMEQGGGRIINFASHRAYMADGRHTIYDATKAGVEAITRSFAVAGAKKGIVCNTIAPTYVMTPMTYHNLEDENWAGRILSRIPLGRFMEIEEVANTAIFLGTDKSSGITGQTIIIDGGWTINE